MKKAFEQTVRDIKRGVNKKVLKVPSIEQKVLDATSNEPWGPHGTLLADIAQASRNYHEYQMIMSVIWKRINDTGKNWRHVYKGLTVLEYLVANGSERVIDEIREHGYQISTLSEFQYIDHTGRDQGSNVRKKSQSLVALVNDKERLQEVRQKAAANRDKFRNTTGSGMYRPGSYDDDRSEGRYGSRDEDRNGYGREREWGDDKYGKYGDSYGRDGGRYSEERYGRDGYRDDEYRGRSRSVDGDNNGQRSRSSDRDRERAYEDDGQYSSRRSNAQADDQPQDGRPLDRKFSEQNLGAPPSYEDVVSDGRSPAYSERDGETAAAFPPKSLSPPVSTNHQEPAVASRSPPPAAAAPPPAAATPPPAAAAPPSAAAASPVAAIPSPPAATSNVENDGFDAFDPRASFSAAPAPAAAPPTLGGAEMDLLGSLSDVFSSNALALVPSTTITSEVDPSTNPNPGQTFGATSSASGVTSQPFDDPFGDGPFRAVPSSDGFSAQPQTTSAFTAQTAEPPHPVPPTSESPNNFGFGDSVNQSTDILADILPPSGPPHTAFQAQSGQLPTQTSFPSQTSQPFPQTGYMSQASQPFSQTGFPAQPNQSTFYQGGPPTSQPGFPSQVGQPMPQPGFQPQGGQPILQPGFQTLGGHPMPQQGFQTQGGFPSQMGSVSGFLGSNGQLAQPGNFYGGYQPQDSSALVPTSTQVSATPAAQQQYTASNFYQQQQTQSSSPLVSSQPAITASAGALAIVPQQPAKDKFETKSTVWADTLNRGLVNLNISGSKTNPLSDIGIDFEAINRKEKRMEKPSAIPATSNVSMGKAMGSGSGIGRAGAGALRAAPSPMAGIGMGVGMGGPGFGGGYGGVNQPMHMGMGQGFQMQQQGAQAGYPPGPGIPGSYNAMMGRGGGYGQQPPPYGGYR